MGWLVIDIFIAYLFRAGFNFWKKLVSLQWSKCDGEITEYNYINPDIGCDYGEYRYTYTVNHAAYDGTYCVPYFMSRTRSARISSSIGAKVRVKVSSDDPTKSVLTDF